MKDIVPKHSSVVHISHNFSLIQQQSWNVMFAKAYPAIKRRGNIDKQEKYRISIGELAKFVDSASNKDHLKKSIKQLTGIVVEYNIFEKDKGWNLAQEAMPLLSWVRIEGNTIYYKYEVELLKKLVNPSMYAKINLFIQKAYKGSRYGWFLYELCFDYLKWGETGLIPLQILKKYFGVEDSYPQFKIFKRDVVNPALRDMNKQTDLTARLETFRKGRKIAAVKFVIEAKESYQLEFPSRPEQGQQLGDSAALQELKSSLDMLGVSDKKAREFLSGHSEEEVKEAIQCAEEENKSSRGVVNPDGFLAHALKVGRKSKKTVTLLQSREEEKKTRDKLEALEIKNRIEKELRSQELAELEREKQEYQTMSLSEKWAYVLEEAGTYEKLNRENKRELEKVFPKLAEKAFSAIDLLNEFESVMLKVLEGQTAKENRKRTKENFKKILKELNAN